MDWLFSSYFFIIFLLLFFKGSETDTWFNKTGDIRFGKCQAGAAVFVGKRLAIVSKIFKKIIDVN